MAPPKPIPKPAPKPAPKPVPRPPPVIIINPGTGNTNNPNCYRPDNTYSCPVDTRRKRSNGLYVGIAFAAMFALVVLILAAIHFARWRARRRALKERAALEVEGKSVDNSDGLTAAAFGGAGGGVVVGGVDGVDGGVSGMEQIQGQAIAMPYGVPTYPMPTPNVFVNPASSGLKEYVDEKVDAGGLSFLPISSRPDTPEETPEVSYTSPPSSILPTDNTAIINEDHTPITNASIDVPGPKEEWTPESIHIPGGSVDTPPSSKQ